MAKRIKIHLIALLTSLSCCSLVYAQTEILNFVYKDYSEAITRNMLDVRFYLSVSGQKSVGFSQLKIFTDTVEKIIKDDKVIIKSNKVADTQRVHIYKNFLDKELIFETGVSPFFEKNTLFVDSLDIFFWVLKQDTKLIDTFLCYKAEANFRGRHYIAWYSPSIPISDGPWKFNGLPGLIMEVQDLEDVVHWKISNLYTKQSYVRNYPNKINGYYKDFKKLIRLKLQLYQKAMESDEGVNDPLCAGCKSSRTIKILMPEDVFLDK